MVNDQLKAIERIAIDTVPDHEWQKIFVTASAVETYKEFDAQYIKTGQDEATSFDIYDLDYVNDDLDNNDVMEFIQKLRDDIYKDKPNRGAFYSVKVEISKDKDPILWVDYDSKPTFEGDVPDKYFIKDLKIYPREPKYIPEWLSAIL